nr:PKD domain-containing protein [Bacteroidales bacterium]
SYGCRDTLVRSFTINPEVTAGFSLAPGNIGCTPFTVAFTNTSVRANSYQWSFGDNTSSSAVSPVHTYENYGPADSVRNIRLIATSFYYCADTAFAQITVRPFIKADFTVQPDKGCSPLQVTIQNMAVGGSSIISYEWDFGDGSTSNSSAPALTHTYTNTTGLVQIRQLRLVVTNQQGCTDTLIRQITVYPEVSAQFTQDVVQGCNPLTVHFTRPANNAVVTWNWNFGQGSTSSTPDPVTVFQNAGGNDTTFTVQLIVTSSDFCRDTFSSVVTVYPFIDAQFTIDRDEGCVTYPVTISNQSSVMPGISSFEWNFGDGSPLSNSNSALLNHTYSNPGAVTQIYNLRLVVRNHAGCTDTLIRPVRVFPRVISAFTPSVPAGCTPLTVSFSNTSNIPVASSFQWDFGNGATSGAVNPLHVFENSSSVDTTYRVRLIASSANQCTDTSWADIMVYSFVKAAFTVDTNASCSPFAVAISNSSAGGISQYQWNFGDGSPVSGVPAPAHTYVNQTLAPQVHLLKLRVQNPHGCADSLERTITVYPEVRAAFEADVTEGCDPLTVALTNQSNAPVAQVYYWEFGNGASSELTNPQYTYIHYNASDQIYTIRLHAVSQYGCSDDTTLDITVYSYIDADFKMNDQDVCSGFPLRFENTSLGGINQVFWDFDGNGSVDSNDTSPFFDHPYANPNDNPIVYNALLRVNNAHGCTDSVVCPVTVYPKVTAAFTYDSAGCSPLEVQFVNTSLRGSSPLGNNGFYTWDFGDQTTSTLEHPAKIFYNYNDFDIIRTVKLIATSEYFCQDSIEKTVYVYHKPRAIFTVDRTIDCPPFNIAIQNNSYTTNASFFWDFGDGQRDTTFVQSGLSHIYYNVADTIQNYNLHLRVHTNRNCVDSSNLTVSVYPQVFAEFTYDSSGCSPFVAGFTNQSVHATDFYWDFGDGSVSSLMNPVKRFVNPA